MNALRSAAVVTCLVAMSVAPGCARPAIVALPSTSATWIGDYAAEATTPFGVTVEAHTRDWPGGPVDLGGRATPVWVRVENGGPIPLELSRDAFELVAGTASFRALPPDQLGSSGTLRARELEHGRLEPGQSASGLLYFEPVIGEWGFLHLRTLLVDAGSRALADTIDVPFGTGRRARCPRDPSEREEPRTGDDILFHGCLPRL